jgi:hypothetical protein
MGRRKFAQEVQPGLEPLGFLGRRWISWLGWSSEEFPCDSATSYTLVSVISRWVAAWGHRIAVISALPSRCLYKTGFCFCPRGEVLPCVATKILGGVAN